MPTYALKDHDFHSAVLIGEAMAVAALIMAIAFVVVDVGGPELPVMDGSSEPWVQLIQNAGTLVQNRPRGAWVCRRAVTVTDGDKVASLAPAGHFQVTCDIDFIHPAIGPQRLTPQQAADMRCAQPSFVRFLPSRCDGQNLLLRQQAVGLLSSLYDGLNDFGRSGDVAHASSLPRGR